MDSVGATIDFLLSARRDAAAAKRFFQKALRSPGHPRRRNQCGRGPLVSQGDRRIEKHRRTGEPVPLPPRPVPERLETTRPGQAGLPLLLAATRTIQGIETMNMIRKGQVRWVPNGNIAGQVAFVA
jgi:hypothetical protein